MENPVVNPHVPYSGKIPGGLVPGRMCRIQGVSHPEADRFDINFQTGPNAEPQDDTSLHISVRHNQGYIARNSYKDEEWGEEMGSGDLPIGHTEPWEIIILVDEYDYKGITGLGEGGGESATKASALKSQGGPQFGGYAPPQGGYAPPQGGYAPPQGPGAYAPPQGYGGYGAAPGYGGPPQGYGPPPPPGAQPQGGFDFLDTAQSLLAGAIKSGAAANILKGFMSSGSQPKGQGYEHHNAKYGIYPDLPQDTNLNIDPNKREPSTVEKLLTGLLSGSSPQQTAGAGPISQNQPVDIGAMLTNLLSGHQSSQAAPSHGAPQTNAPGAQPPAGDIGSLLSSLLSGGNQGEKPHGAGPNPAPNQGADLNNLLSALLSGSATRPLQENTGAGHQQPHGGSQPQGNDFGSLLSGLLSGGSNQNAPGYQHPPGHQSTQQTQGLDLNSLLSGLLSSTGGQQQAGGYEAPRTGGGYQPPRPVPQPRRDDGAPGADSQRHDPARAQREAKPDEINDVTDAFEREVGRAGGGGTNQRPHGGQGDEVGKDKELNNRTILPNLEVARHLVDLEA
ncbi:unnamed protein product [Phyllotreta striolata]|uniref:Galectin domain-containing protein n=1 Tax=Phyllotreta striolata TaxID=444603 RepID=A0A9N9TKQ1_PHYSR|nr:unnamed protein product [Phyllotreta striolata]